MNAIKTNDIVISDGKPCIVKAIRFHKNDIILDLQPIQQTIKTVRLQDVKLEDQLESSYRSKFSQPSRSGKRNSGVKIKSEKEGFSLDIPDGMPKHKVRKILRDLLEQIDE